jgi:hypothetical protein
MLNKYLFFIKRTTFKGNVESTTITIGWGEKRTPISIVILQWKQLRAITNKTMITSLALILILISLGEGFTFPNSGVDYKSALFLKKTTAKEGACSWWPSMIAHDMLLTRVLLCRIRPKRLLSGGMGLFQSQRTAETRQEEETFSVSIAGWFSERSRVWKRYSFILTNLSTMQVLIAYIRISFTKQSVIYSP